METGGAVAGKLTRPRSGFIQGDSTQVASTSGAAGLAEPFGLVVALGSDAQQLARHTAGPSRFRFAAIIVAAAVVLESPQ